MEINSEETNPNPGKRISLPDVFQPVPFLLGGGSESGKGRIQNLFPRCFFRRSALLRKKKERRNDLRTGKGLKWTKFARLQNGLNA